MNTISDLTIVNRALLLMRARPLSSLSESSRLAGLCASTFSGVRTEVLASYPWNCALTRSSSLAQLMGDPPFGFKARYALPPDCLRVWEVFGNPVWKREGSCLLTDAVPPIYISYIADVPSTALDIWVANAISSRLAAMLCPAVTENRTDADSLTKLAEAELKRAKQQDCQEGTPTVDEEAGDWITSRY